MKLPRNLYGRDLAHVLCSRWSYTKDSQVGNHIILQTGTSEYQRIWNTDRNPLRIGMRNTILREFATVKGVSRKDILVTQ